LVAEKNCLIHRYPKKFPQMELGRHFKDFKMVRNFVKNTPWWSREEKVTIQAFHKLVWHLECSSNEVSFIYQILIMKKNKPI
jgi:hypothetical protein